MQYSVFLRPAAQQRQQESNRQTRQAWERCASHRARLNAIIGEAAAPAHGAGSICVLGAGNCNDLDLRQLSAGFASVSLVDLDREALEEAVERQHASGVRLIAPFDLSGVLDTLDSEPNAILHRLGEPAPVDVPGGPFDVVASCCVLTQMFQSIEDAGLATVEPILALRRRHLRQLWDLTRAGGAFVLATDVVSTTTAPDLNDIPEPMLGRRLERLIEQRNFFTGANPAAIWQELLDEFVPEGAVLVSHDPWMWPLAQSHSYLTWAVTVRRPSVNLPKQA